MPFLNWINKNQAVETSDTVPYHLLKQQKNYGDTNAAQDNLIIQGDNLQALKALLPFYTGKVKCIYIDPPYNTQSAFAHYDDKLEHSQWLSMMYPRLVLLRELLSDDGSIWVSIDDRESHYLKVLMDEIFGRGNFVSNVIWEKSDSPKMDARLFSSRHDHIIVFAKNIKSLSLHKQAEDVAEHYNKVDNDGKKYYTKPLRAMGNGEDTREARPSMFFPLIAPDGTVVLPKKPDGTDGRWRWGNEKVISETDRIEWIKGKQGWTPYYRIYADDENAKRPPETIWANALVGSNRTSKAEVKALFNEETTFATPKPEGVIWQVLRLASNPNDLVLDSFLGSGTTAAVAHKMGRRYIGIEMGDHAQTHCIPRLQKVIDGEQGGISKAVNWTGGGGFSFVTLGEAVFDHSGHITQGVKFADLAAYIWWLETKTALGVVQSSTPFIGEHRVDEDGGTAYYLLYNGILGDRRPNGGNVLTKAVLAQLLAAHPHTGNKVIFGESSRLGAESLAKQHISFKQIPYQLHDRV